MEFKFVLADEEVEAAVETMKKCLYENLAQFLLRFQQEFPQFFSRFLDIKGYCALDRTVSAVKISSN